MKSENPTTTDPNATAPEILTGESSAEILLVCDHASNHIPAVYQGLGVSADDLARHIAYDIGAADLTRALSRRLGAPAILSTFSRLVIDANRGEGDPTLVMKVSDGAVIPGNRHVDAKEVQKRLNRHHRPYHRAVAATLRELLTVTPDPALISIHSFTPEWKGHKRPWHAGVLWDEDDRLVVPMLHRLQQESDLVVGDNVPYTGRLVDDCMNRHGTRNGLPHALIETRQDIISDPRGVEAWADRLAPAIVDAVRLYRDKHG